MIYLFEKNYPNLNFNNIDYDKLEEEQEYDLDYFYVIGTSEAFDTCYITDTSLIFGIINMYEINYFYKDLLSTISLKAKILEIHIITGFANYSINIKNGNSLRSLSFILTYKEYIGFLFFKDLDRKKNNFYNSKCIILNCYQRNY